MKFSIGQNVIITRYNHWIGEYDIKATIIGFANVYLNGVPAYKLKTINGDIIDCLSGNDIKL